MAPVLISALLACVIAGGSATSSFLVMGDWGGDEHSPYTTPSEVDTAQGMNSIAQELGAKYALALGDNMYHSGVTSVKDRRFDETFERVFTGDALSEKSGFKFHLVAGNHDHIGNVDAQIEYSNVSARWMFPDLYYTFTQFTEDKAVVQFVMLDTIIIAGNSQIRGQCTQLAGSKLPGPTHKAASDQQLQWLEKTLSESQADYLIVAGHYPIYSVCEHGPTLILQEKVLPLLLKYKVSAYFAGHDHCAEHIDVGDGVQYHGIGSAAYHVNKEDHKGTLKPGQLKYHDGDAGGGFASVVASKTQLLVTHHDDDGKRLYNSTVSPRSVSSLVV